MYIARKINLIKCEFEECHKIAEFTLQSSNKKTVNLCNYHYQQIQKNIEVKRIKEASSVEKFSKNTKSNFLAKVGGNKSTLLSNKKFQASLDRQRFWAVVKAETIMYILNDPSQWED